MNDLKKIFFLILLAGLIIAPQAARAATLDVVFVMPTANPASLVAGSGQISTLTIETRDINNNLTDVDVLSNISLTIIAGRGTVTPSPTSRISLGKYTGTYTATPETANYNGVTIQVTVNGKINTFGITLTTALSLDLRVGKTCNEQKDCCTDPTVPNCVANNGHVVRAVPWNSTDGVTKVDMPLQCVDSKCTVPNEYVAIGTWCKKAAQCEDETGKLLFTCDGNNDYCVGAVNNVPCIDEMARLNKDIQIGTLGVTIEESDRCSTGLVCDSGDSGKCQNDFGQGEIPTDKLGETAKDIRDQIRNIINIALGFLGVAGVILVIYGGAIWLSAVGDDEKVGKAKKTIVAGMIGLVIIGVAWTIVSYVLTVTQDIG